MEKVRKEWIDRLFLIGAFVIMGILFYSSATPYSNQTVTPVLDKVLAGEPFKAILSKIEFMYAGTEISVAASGYSHFIEFFIRKGAHFFIYLLLGLCWFMGLKDRMDSVPLAALIALLLAAGYASFDEFHQGLTPERTPLLEDIILDTAGAFTGILSSWLVAFKTGGRKRRRKYRV